MTFKPSTESHGEAVLMWCLAASRVRTSLLLEKVPESTASEAVCGSTWRESSVRYCRNSSSWKTHQCLWEEVLEPSSLTLPKWGMIRNGVLWERITLPLLTSGTESGSSERWATPTTMDKLPPKSADALHKEATQARPGRSKPANLRDQVSNSHIWPTPNQRDWKDTGATQGNRKSPNLGTMVHQRIWPTPQAHKTTESGEIVNADGTPWDGLSKPHSKTTGRPITTALADAVKFATPQARDFRTGSTDRWDNPERSRNLNDQIGGQLNPTWVEWLMGWPLGWTDCAASATAKFRQWCRSHGISYEPPPMKFNKSNVQAMASADTQTPTKEPTL
jgi:hypothetical protein